MVKPHKAKRLWVEAVDFERDGIGVLDCARDLAIALDSVTSLDPIMARKGICDCPGSDRQRQLIKRDVDRGAYLDHVRDEPCKRRVIYRDDQSLPLRSCCPPAADSISMAICCLQRPFVGKRSAGSVATMRIVANAEGRCAPAQLQPKGKLQRMQYLVDNRGHVRRTECMRLRMNSRAIA